VSVMPPQTTVFQVASVTNLCGQGLPGNPATATVTVKIPTITTGSLASSIVCAGTGLSVPFTTTGEFNSGNVFRVEISTDTTSRASLTVGVGNGQTEPIGISLPTSISAGIYFVRVVASNPGIAVFGRTSPIPLNIRPFPTAILVGTQDVYEGNLAKMNVTFTGDGPWTFVYADSLRSTTVATNANPHVVEVRPLRNTAYRLISVVNNCGFGPISGTAVVRVLPLLSVEDDPLGESVRAYPVPTTSTLTVDIDLPLSKTPAGLTIRDVGGRPILQRTTRDRQTTLDLTAQPPGLYLLNIQVGDKQTTRRVLKQ
jgi:Secretion system C-terminal sorting domain